RQCDAVRAEVDDTVGRRVGHPVSENRAPAYFLMTPEVGAQPGSVEDVVAQRQSHRIGADVTGADDERLSQALGMTLHRVTDVDAELAAVTENSFECGRVRNSGDHLDVANPRHHQRGKR